MGNITRICHAMDKILWSLWICVTGANCDTSERNHQNISLVLQFGGKTVRNRDGLKRFSILALEFLYFNCLVPCGDTPGSHPHSTGSRDTRIRGARGDRCSWKLLELCLLKCSQSVPGLGSLLLVPNPLSPYPPEREQHPEQEPKR